MKFSIISYLSNVLLYLLDSNDKFIFSRTIDKLIRALLRLNILSFVLTKHYFKTIIIWSDL